MASILSISLSRPQLALLTQYLKPRLLGSSGVNGAWERALKMPPDEAVRQFVADGLIELASPFEQIEMLPTSELKDRLKQLGLKHSGNRSELIRRVAAAPGSHQVKNRYWVCSGAGRELANNYRTKEQQRRANAQTKAYAAIAAGNLDRAAEIGAEWDFYNLFPSGLGMEGMTLTFRAALLANRLKFAYAAIESPPKAWVGIQRADRVKLVEIYLKSAVMFDDESKAPELATLSITGDMPPTRAMHILQTWAAARNSLASMKQSAQILRLKVKILSPNDCPLAESFKAKEFEVDEVPELPVAGCQRRLGCACCYSPSVEVD